MNTKILLGVVVVVIIPAMIYFFPDMLQGDKDMPPVEHVIKVELVDSIWKVIYLKDGKKDTVHAKPGDKITWDLIGTDAYFQFNEKDIFGKFKMRPSGKARKQLKLPVLRGAKMGKHFYSIFCTGEPAGFAEQDSPPVIIID